jgi:hypothetical protein
MTKDSIKVQGPKYVTKIEISYQHLQKEQVKGSIVQKLLIQGIDFSKHLTSGHFYKASRTQGIVTHGYLKHHDRSYWLVTHISVLSLLRT